MDKREVLKQYFGHSAFRQGQEELISAILAGRDAFGIMPTGGGKSVCYQIPALMMKGIAIVVSPLISLMKDQVMALKNAGVDAAFVNSSLSGEQMSAVYRNIRNGQYKILYVAPERLAAEGFIALAQSLPISLVAVDEAHCISQWGQDFRPSYLRIVDFLDRLPRRPVLAAFTATATPAVREDVSRILKLRDPVLVITGFDRPNLKYDVLRPENKLSELTAILSARPGKSGIIYCATRSNVDRICSRLCSAGFSATRYHAGLPDGERRANQEDFINDRKSIMVATNAFGMGIDKSNVSFVIHYNMPKSLEAYYQEAGRAGRDGEPADCILLYSAGDIQTARFLIQNPSENEQLSDDERREVIAQDMRRLEAMVGYCKTDRCLRGYILDYFGQAHEPACENCGNCLTGFERLDITRQAQMILSCVKRIKTALGYPVGITLIVHTLHGSSERRVMELGLNRLTTYGLMKDTSRKEIRRLMEQLEADGYLYADPVHGGILLTKQAGRALFEGEQVFMLTKKLPSGSGGGKKRSQNALPAVQADGELLTALKALRTRLAREEAVPAYIIFSNATLSDMAAKAPTDMYEFMEVSGVGNVKAAKYGDVFISEIKKFMSGQTEPDA